jgi:hypothetical protein
MYTLHKPNTAHQIQPLQGAVRFEPIDQSGYTIVSNIVVTLAETSVRYFCRYQNTKKNAAYKTKFKQASVKFKPLSKQTRPIISYPVIDL